MKWDRDGGRIPTKIEKSDLQSGFGVSQRKQSKIKGLSLCRAPFSAFFEDISEVQRVLS